MAKTMTERATVWREDDRIRATDGQGYSDRVDDDDIRGHMPHEGSRAAEADAFCRAVLAIREYERAVAVHANRRNHDA